MTAAEFRKELNKLRGGYLFCGEEDYIKHRYLALAREALVEEGDAFNHICLTADNYSADRLMGAIELLPVMADTKLIEVSGLSLDTMNEGELEELITVLGVLPDYEYNVLILYCEVDELDPGTVKQPTKRLTQLASVLKPVIFWRETPARLASWTAKHFAAEQIVAPPAAVNRLLERCGCDMFALSSEIEKLCWYLKAQGREQLNEADVLAVSSVSREIAAFDFANAILDGKANEAFAILGELKLRKERPEILLSGIARVICDLLTVKVQTEGGFPASVIASRLGWREYKTGLYIKSASRCSTAFLHRLVEQCYEADRLIKSTPVDSYVVLDRLAAEAVMR